MIIKINNITFFLTFILLFAPLFSIEYKEYDAFSRPYIPYDSTKVNQDRLMFSISTAVLSTGVSYYAVKTAWWYDEAKDFHFDK